MADEYLHVGPVQEHRSANGMRVLRYSVELSHSGLKQHKVLSAPEYSALKRKLQFQIERWRDKWDILEHRRANAQEAERLTCDAQKSLEDLEKLLEHSLTARHAIDWRSLKVHNKFHEPRPVEPREPRMQEPPRKPRDTWPQFKPHLNIFDKMFARLKAKKIRQAGKQLQAAIDRWQKRIDEIQRHNLNLKRAHSKAVRKWRLKCEAWEERRRQFYSEQERHNRVVDDLRQRYKDRDQNAVEDYCRMVLENSEYPGCFPKDFDLLYNPDTKILVCEYFLPSPESLPKLKEVKFIASKNQLRESYLSHSQAEKMYDRVVYQAVLRTLHELFEADTADAVDAIIMNGRVRFVNKATGKEEEACIISIQVDKKHFSTIELRNVDPKSCFKALKGIGSSKLYGISAVQPILQIDRTDRRFVEAHNVADGLDEATNVAAMDWEEFEHLIRELFEKEFSQNGGEVKITQASRDRGVDAVAFDPDPIRGGKIVIQAKRYTNTVPVSAVRDLYGTVVNEGAAKGILVTTSDYGPDAYKFAANKPLTLFNGGHLLALLGKHGHKVKIDIKEAKKILAESEH